MGFRRVVVVFCSVVDPNADPDLTYHPDADPDPGPDPSLQRKANTLEKVLK